MGIRRYRGQILFVKDWPDGSRFKRKYPNEAQARKMQVRIEAAILDGTWSELKEKLKLRGRDVVKFLEFVETYMEDYVNVRNTPSTYRRKVASFKQLNRILGKRDLDSVTPACVHTYVRRRKDGGASNSTINRDLAALKHMFQYAVQCGVIESNPLQHFKSLKEPLKAIPRYSKEEVDKVIRAVRADCQPIFVFIRETGCRLEEALSIEHCQLDFQRRFVVFTHKTKAGRYRIVPLTAAAAEAAQALPQLENCPYVFYNESSQTRWHNCRKPWVDARRKAGVPELRVKDLRYHYAIGLAESGADMHDIRQVLGHSTVAVTERHYAQFSPHHSGKRILRILEGGRSKELTRNQRRSA